LGSSMIFLVYCKNFCKYHNIHPSNTTMKKLKNKTYKLCWESKMIESNNLSHRRELSEPDRNPEFKLPVHLLSS
jgi:hypothetical protein